MRRPPQSASAPSRERERESRLTKEAALLISLNIVPNGWSGAGSLFTELSNMQLRYHEPITAAGRVFTLHNHCPLLSRSLLGIMPFHASSNSLEGNSGSWRRSRMSLVCVIALLRGSRHRLSPQSSSRFKPGCTSDLGSKHF
jgi:hypothetical protein